MSETKTKDAARPKGAGEAKPDFVFFPGCSLHSTAREYHDSTVQSMAVLGITLEELDDWNCCGATALSSADSLLSYALPARNLAMTQERGLPMAVACNSCFVTLNRVNALMETDAPYRSKVEETLKAIGRRLDGPVEIRHTLHIIYHDVGLDRIREKVKRRLEGLKVAPYYGCQIARPRHEFSDPEFPTEMDDILEAIGAEVVRYDRKTKCCGGALMTTKEDVVLELNEQLLREAQVRGADLIAVCCPMCQMNLDAYQGKINSRFGTDYKLPVVYFTQLLGFALGLDEKAMGFGRGFVPAGKHLKKYA
ncbi:MAG TPA: disulfide reductase [Clostridiales bacterium]|nr:disulfide reductase [Clostridiales bacterium]